MPPDRPRLPMARHGKPTWRRRTHLGPGMRVLDLASASDDPAPFNRRKNCSSGRVTADGLRVRRNDFVCTERALFAQRQQGHQQHRIPRKPSAESLPFPGPKATMSLPAALESSFSPILPRRCATRMFPRALTPGGRGRVRLAWGGKKRAALLTTTGQGYLNHAFRRAPSSATIPMDRSLVMFGGGRPSSAARWRRLVQQCPRGRKRKSASSPDVGRASTER